MLQAKLTKIVCRAGQPVGKRVNFVEIKIIK